MRLVLGVPTAIIFPLLKLFGWTWDRLATALAGRFLNAIGPDAPSESPIYGVKVVYWSTSKQFRCEWAAFIIMQVLFAALIIKEVSTFFPVVFYGMAPVMCLWCAYHSPISPLSSAVLVLASFAPSIMTVISFGGKHPPMLLFGGWSIVWATLATVVVSVRHNMRGRIAETYRADLSREAEEINQSPE